jgi:hypothetical protein
MDRARRGRDRVFCIGLSPLYCPGLYVRGFYPALLEISAVRLTGGKFPAAAGQSLDGPVTGHDYGTVRHDTPASDTGVCVYGTR